MAQGKIIVETAQLDAASAKVGELAGTYKGEYENCINWLRNFRLHGLEQIIRRIQHRLKALEMILRKCIL